MLTVAVRRKMSRELRSLPRPFPPISAVRVRTGGLGDEPGVLLVTVRSYASAYHFLILNITCEIYVAILSAENSGISIERAGVTRNACFLISFIVVHTDVKVRMYVGSYDSNGCGYAYDRLHWISFYFQAKLGDHFVVPLAQCGKRFSFRQRHLSK